MRVPVFLSLLMTTIFVGNAYGDSGSDNGIYIQANAGLSMFQDSEITADGLTAVGIPSIDLEFDNTFTLGGGVGYKFDSFRVQADLSYRNADVDSFKVLGVAVESSALGLSVDASVFTPMLNGFYDIDLDSSITPFLGGGIGMAFIDAEVEGVSDDDSAFAWNAIAGASFAVTDNMDIVAFYRFLGTGDFDFGSDEGELEGFMAHELNVGVRFQF